MKPRRLSKPRRFTAVVVSTAYFATQILFSPPFVQSLHASPTPNTAPNFWKTRAVSLPKNNFPAVSAENMTKLAQSNVKPSPVLDPVLKKISPFVQVRSVHVGRAGAPAVLLVQDVHANREAQRNIGQALLRVPNALVAVEAASGRFDFTARRSFPDASVTREIADYLLRENLISAVSWFGFSATSTPAVAGVDDGDLYRRNVEAFRSAHAAKASTLNSLEEAQRSLRARSRSELSSEALRLADGIWGYYDGASTIHDFVAALSVWAPLAGYPAVARLDRAVRLEKSIDNAAAHRERSRLFARLATNARFAAELAQWGSALNAGAVDTVAFHAAVAKMLARERVSLKDAPHFSAYLDYIALADSIDHDRLFKQIGAMTEAAVANASSTPAQRGLFEKTTQLCLAKKLVNFELTPEEWARLSSSWNVSIQDPLSAGKADPSLRHAGMTACQDFYRLADLRSERMAENLLALDLKGVVPVLVAGGFHTPAILAALHKKGLSTVVVTPKLGGKIAGQGSDYLNAFLRDRTPLEKLFEGAKLTLADGAQLAGAPESRYFPAPSAPTNAARLLEAVATERFTNPADPRAVVEGVEVGPSVKPRRDVDAFRDVLGYERIGYRPLTDRSWRILLASISVAFITGAEAMNWVAIFNAVGMIAVLAVFVKLTSQTARSLKRRIDSNRLIRFPKWWHRVYSLFAVRIYINGTGRTGIPNLLYALHTTGFNVVAVNGLGNEVNGNLKLDQITSLLEHDEVYGDFGKYRVRVVGQGRAWLEDGRFRAARRERLTDELFSVEHVSVYEPGIEKTIRRLDRVQPTWRNVWMSEAKPDGEARLEWLDIEVKGRVKRVLFFNARNDKAKYFPARALNVVGVSESSGALSTRKKMRPYLTENGAQITAWGFPPKDKTDHVPVSVLGVNHQHIFNVVDNIVSNCSCTTNGATPLLYALAMMPKWLGFAPDDYTPGIERGDLTTVHGPTVSGQKTIDFAQEGKKAKGQSPASGNQTIATTTGFSDVAEPVLNSVGVTLGAISAVSFRVPANPSLVDLSVDMKVMMTLADVVKGFFIAAGITDARVMFAYADQINRARAFRNEAPIDFDAVELDEEQIEMAKRSPLKGIIKLIADPSSYSSKYAQSDGSTVLNLAYLNVQYDPLIKESHVDMSAWYANEWAYAVRTLQTLWAFAMRFWQVKGLKFFLRHVFFGWLPEPEDKSPTQEKKKKEDDAPKKVTRIFESAQSLVRDDLGRHGAGPKVFLSFDYNDDIQQNRALLYVWNFLSGDPRANLTGLLGMPASYEALSSFAQMIQEPSDYPHLPGRIMLVKANETEKGRENKFPYPVLRYYEGAMWTREIALLPANFLSSIDNVNTLSDRPTILALNESSLTQHVLEAGFEKVIPFESILNGRANAAFHLTKAIAELESNSIAFLRVNGVVHHRGANPVLTRLDSRRIEGNVIVGPFAEAESVESALAAEDINVRVIGKTSTVNNKTGSLIKVMATLRHPTDLATVKSTLKNYVASAHKAGSSLYWSGSNDRILSSDRLNAPGIFISEDSIEVNQGRQVVVVAWFDDRLADIDSLNETALRSHKKEMAHDPLTLALNEERRTEERALELIASGAPETEIFPAIRALVSPAEYGPNAIIARRINLTVAALEKERDKFTQKLENDKQEDRAESLRGRFNEVIDPLKKWAASFAADVDQSDEEDRIFVVRLKRLIAETVTRDARINELKIKEFLLDHVQLIDPRQRDADYQARVRRLYEQLIKMPFPSDGPGQKKRGSLFMKIAALNMRESRPLLISLLTRFLENGYSVRERDMGPILDFMDMAHGTNDPQIVYLLKLLSMQLFSHNSTQELLPTNEPERRRTRRGVHGWGIHGVIREEVHNLMGEHAIGLIERALEYYRRYDGTDESAPSEAVYDVLFSNEVYQVDAYKAKKSIPEFEKSVFPKNAVFSSPNFYSDATASAFINVFAAELETFSSGSGKGFFELVRTLPQNALRDAVEKTNQKLGTRYEWDRVADGADVVDYLWVYRQFCRRYSLLERNALLETTPAIAEIASKHGSLRAIDAVIEEKEKLNGVIYRRFPNYDKQEVSYKLVTDHGVDDVGNAVGGARVEDEKLQAYYRFYSYGRVESFLIQTSLEREFPSINEDNFIQAIDFLRRLAKLGYLNGDYPIDQIDHIETIWELLYKNDRSEADRQINQGLLRDLFYMMSMEVREADRFFDRMRATVRSTLGEESPGNVERAVSILDQMRRLNQSHNAMRLLLDRVSAYLKTNPDLPWRYTDGADMEDLDPSKLYVVLGPSSNKEDIAHALQLGRFHLGAKGIGMVRALDLGIPVPPFIIFSPKLSLGQIEVVLPTAMEKLEHEAAKIKDSQLGVTYGGGSQPYALAVRGATYQTIPGQTETMTNVGITRSNFESFVQRLILSGVDPDEARWTIADSWRRFVEDVSLAVFGFQKPMFQKIINEYLEGKGAEKKEDLSGVEMQELAEMYFDYANSKRSGTDRPQLPDNPREQLLTTIDSVSLSANKAQTYLHARNIVGKWPGCSIILQLMAFGNGQSNSGSAIVFSENPQSGAPGFHGDFKSSAQGRDLADGVSANLTRFERLTYTPWQDRVYEVGALFHSFIGKAISELEITIQGYWVWMLQGRSMELPDEGPVFVGKLPDPILSGIGSSGGAFRGVVMSLAHFLELKEGAPFEFPNGRTDLDGVILIADRMMPSDAGPIIRHAKKLGLKRPDGFALALLTQAGGYASHNADIARALGIPFISNVKKLLDTLGPVANNGHAKLLSIDGRSGAIYDAVLSVAQADGNGRRTIVNGAQRSVANRISLAFKGASVFTIAMLLVLMSISGEWHWLFPTFFAFAAIISVVFSGIFIVQGVTLSIAFASTTYRYDLIPELWDAQLFTSSGKNEVAYVGYGELRLNRELFDTSEKRSKLSPAAQRSLAKEEFRHLRYQREKGLEHLLTRTALGLEWEEFVVNGWMWFADLFSSRLPERINSENPEWIHALAAVGAKPRHVAHFVRLINELPLERRQVVLRQILDVDVRWNDDEKVRVAAHRMLVAFDFFNEIVESVNLSFTGTPPEAVATKISLAAMDAALVPAVLREKKLTGSGKDQKKAIDKEGKDVTTALIHKFGYQGRFTASEGLGRDADNEGLTADDAIGVEVVNPTGKKIRHIAVDVVENTNAASKEDKTLATMEEHHGGGTTPIVTGRGTRALGNVPDAYADVIAFHVPPEKRHLVKDIDPLVPDETEQSAYEDIKKKYELIASANGVPVGELEVVVLKRTRETKEDGMREQTRISAIKRLAGETGMTVKEITDGTLDNGFRAGIGRKSGKVLVFHSTSGAPEAWQKLLRLAPFMKRGAVVRVRLYSKRANSASTESAIAKKKDAENLAQRFNWGEDEIKEIRGYREANGDADEILGDVARGIVPTRVFGLEDVRDVFDPALEEPDFIDAATGSITDSGGFQVRGAQNISQGKFLVHVLRISTNDDGNPYWWMDAFVIKEPARFAYETPEKIKTPAGKIVPISIFITTILSIAFVGPDGSFQLWQPIAFAIALTLFMLVAGARANPMTENEFVRRMLAEQGPQVKSAAITEAETDFVRRMRAGQQELRRQEEDEAEKRANAVTPRLADDFTWVPFNLWSDVTDMLFRLKTANLPVKTDLLLLVLLARGYSVEAPHTLSGALDEALKRKNNFGSPPTSGAVSREAASLYIEARAALDNIGSEKDFGKDPRVSHESSWLDVLALRAVDFRFDDLLSGLREKNNVAPPVTASKLDFTFRPGTKEIDIVLFAGHYSLGDRGRVLLGRLAAHGQRNDSISFSDVRGMLQLSINETHAVVNGIHAARRRLAGEGPNLKVRPVLQMAFAMLDILDQTDGDDMPLRLEMLRDAMANKKSSTEPDTNVQQSIGYREFVDQFKLPRKSQALMNVLLSWRTSTPLTREAFAKATAMTDVHERLIPIRAARAAMSHADTVPDRHLKILFGRLDDLDPPASAAPSPLAAFGPMLFMLGGTNYSYADVGITLLIVAVVLAFSLLLKPKSEPTRINLAAAGDVGIAVQEIESLNLAQWKNSSPSQQPGYLSHYSYADLLAVNPSDILHGAFFRAQLNELASALEARRLVITVPPGQDDQESRRLLGDFLREQAVPFRVSDLRRVKFDRSDLADPFELARREGKPVRAFPFLLKGSNWNLRELWNGRKSAVQVVIEILDIANRRRLSMTGGIFEKADENRARESQA